MGKSRRSRSVLLFAAGVALVSAACVPTKPPPPPDPCEPDTVVISGDACLWFFQRDAANMTTGEFNTEEFHIGTGSLRAGPIGAPPAEKYIAEFGLADGAIPVMSVAELVSIAYHFQVGGNGSDAEVADRPYLNVYTTFSDPAKFYDCRFDYIPVSASTMMFTDATFAATDTAPELVNVEEHASSPSTCPTTLAGMPAGSHLRFFSISVGDTTATDDGLAGYLDNVRITTTAGTKTFDFEPA